MQITNTRRTQDIVLARLAKQIGGRPEQFVERLSNQVVSKLGRTEPPFQTEAFEYAGIAGAKVIQTDLRAAGLMSIFNGQILIEVNRNDTEERKSYTVCHEVGHIEFRRAAKLLDTSSGRKSSRNNGVDAHSSRKEEWLADLFAANLLMPREVFTLRAHELPPSLDHAIELAQMFRTSLGATLRRIVSLGVWECVMMWCIPEKMKGEDDWAVRIQEFKSSISHSSLICPRHKYVWWGGEAVREAFASDRIIKEMLTIDDESWRFEGRREWYYNPSEGRQNRVMTLLVPSVAK